MQAVGYVLLARFLFASWILDQINSQAIERRVETLDLSEARHSLTKSSIELKTLFGTQENNGLGGMVGGRFSLFISPNVFLGGGGYGGRFFGSGAGAGSFGYGGMLAGAEILLGDRLALEGTTLLGVGGADYHSASGPASGSSIVVEPQVAIVFKFAKGVRMGGQVSYVSFSQLEPLSGWTGSVFVEFRRFSLSLPD